MSKTNQNITKNTGLRTPAHYKTHLSWLLPLFACLLFVNTLTHDYTQDDAIVIYDNMYTQEGISGIPGLLTKDTFHGFFKVDGKEKLVKGGRYRPLTPVMFALEYQLFGRSPFIGHLINVLLYALLIFVLWKLLMRLFYQDQQLWTLYFVAMAVAIFAAHPIHTEVVANIKGRDEIVALLGSLTALFLMLGNPGIKRICLASLVYFLALMSKENAITFLAVIPLTIHFFDGKILSKAIRRTLPLIVVTLAFLAIRTAVLGFDFGGISYELMNNPFLKIDGSSYIPFSDGERWATILHTLGLYIKLLLFPHPLTHDYYPRHISIMSFSDVSVILSIVFHVLLLALLVYNWKRKQIITWALAFYFITLSIVSNIVFPIGTNMSERFVFMPSVGFAVLISYVLFTWIYPRSKIMTYAIGAILLMAYTYKTISRNGVWKNDFTLFTTDVHTSTNSAKVLNAAGGALSTKASSLPEGAERQRMLIEAEGYLKRAIKIYPNYKNAYLLLGNVSYFLKNYDGAIAYYNQSLQLDPGFEDAAKNLSITYRDAGRHAGEQQGNLTKALSYLKQSNHLDPNDIETIRLLGVASGMSGLHEEAVTYFEQVVKARPLDASAYRNLSRAYVELGNEEAAERNRLKANRLEGK